MGHTDLDVFWDQSSCHMEFIFQVWHFSIKQSLSYRAKSLDHEIYNRHTDLDIFLCQSSGHMELIFLGLTFLHQIVFKICQNHGIMKYRWQWPRYILRSIIESHGTYVYSWYMYVISPSNSLRVIRQNHWTVKCRPHWPRHIFMSTIGSHGTYNSGMTFLYQIVFNI